MCKINIKSLRTGQVVSTHHRPRAGTSSARPPCRPDVDTLFPYPHFLLERHEAGGRGPEEKKRKSSIIFKRMLMETTEVNMWGRLKVSPARRGASRR